MLDHKMGRRHLDSRLAPIIAVRSSLDTPPKGWIKAIRQALGMTTMQLARRMGVRQPTIVNIEQSESADRIQLGTLRRAAEALDCELVYALVPRQSLEAIVEKRALQLANRTMSSVEHSMRLEAQGVDNAATERQRRALADSINPKRLWDS
jgi:predicted DNA-binding mobile mystery protein A